MSTRTVIHLALVAAALLGLLALTALAWWLHLGMVSTAIGFGIAVLKAFLIVLFFMELRTSSPLVRIFAFAGLYWLGILIALTLADFLTRA